MLFIYLLSIILLSHREGISQVWTVSLGEHQTQPQSFVADSTCVKGETIASKGCERRSNMKVVFCKTINGEFRQWETIVEKDFSAECADIEIIRYAYLDADPCDVPGGVGVFTVTFRKDSRIVVVPVKIDSDHDIVQLKPNHVECDFGCEWLGVGQGWSEEYMLTVECVHADGFCSLTTLTDWKGVPFSQLALPNANVVRAFCKAAETIFTDETKLVNWVMENVLALSGNPDVRSDIF